MESNTKLRSRGRSLNAQGVEALNQAAAQKWLLQGSRDKLTRSAKADLLGISEATLVRMLSGKRVDQASLDIAFANAGLAWTDKYSLPSEIAPQEPSNGDAPSLPVSSPRPRLLTFAIIAGAILLAALLPSRLPQAVSRESLQSQYVLAITVAEQYYSEGDYLRAQMSLDTAFGISVQLQETETRADQWRLQGDVDAATGKLNEAITHYRHTLEIHRRKGEPNAIPALLEAIGDVQTRTKNFDGASKSLAEAAVSFAELHDAIGVAMALRDLGSVYYETNLLPQAIARFSEASKAIQSDPKQEALRLDIAARRALVISRMGNPAKARSELQRCLDFWTARDHPRWIASTKLQLAQVEMDAGNAPQAKRLLQDSLSGYEVAKDRVGIARVRELLAKLPPDANSR